MNETLSRSSLGELRIGSYLSLPKEVGDLDTPLDNSTYRGGGFQSHTGMVELI
jgi:hypothetical protein